MDLNGYFDPVSLERPEFEYLDNKEAFSHHITVHTPDQPIRELDKHQVAIVGVPVDENGFIKIYGRSKDLINRGGYKIYPYELECMLVDHPKIEQVCIVATPNPVLGESICACVIPRQDQTVTLAEIREIMKDQIAPHKLPDELCIMEDFPKLSGGVKVKKFGPGGLAQLAEKDEKRERIRKK